MSKYLPQQEHTKGELWSIENANHEIIYDCIWTSIKKLPNYQSKKESNLSSGWCTLFGAECPLVPVYRELNTYEVDSFEERVDMFEQLQWHGIKYAKKNDDHDE